MNTVCILGASLILTSLTGCASIMSGKTDTVVFNSAPNGAAFSVTDEDGKPVHHGTTPATVPLARGNGYFNGQTYHVDFSAPGYAPLSQTVDSSLNGWYFGNLIFGGVLGLLIIDPATGAMWSLPDQVNATLAPTASTAPTQNQSP